MMIKNMVISFGRKISAHIFTVCIFCVILLLIGALVQMLSSLAFRSYVDENAEPSNNHLNVNELNNSDLAQRLHLTQNYRNDAIERNTKKQFDRARDSMKGKNGKNRNEQQIDDYHNIFNTKILYRQFTVNNGKANERSASQLLVIPTQKIPIAVSTNENHTKNKLISSKSQENGEVNGNDETIYIDADDETNGPEYLVENQFESDSDENLNGNIVQKLSRDKQDESVDESSSNSAILVSNNNMPNGKNVQNRKFDKLSINNMKQQLQDYRYSDENDSDESDNDDSDYAVNSGSGDFVYNNLILDESANRDWYSSNNRKNSQHQLIESKKFNDYERYPYDDFEDDTEELDKQKLFLEKFTRAHKASMSSSAKNQKQTISTTNGIKKIDNKRRSKASQNTESPSNNVRNGAWMETRVRRIMGNIKKSEERSRQILLCKGEGELCSMLFKAPVKSTSTD